MGFKTFLDEKYINHKGSKKEWDLMLKGMLPVKESVFKDFKKPIEISISYHVTSIDNIKNLQKIQNTKKQISTFTVGAPWLAQGAKTVGEVVLELEGETIFISPIDLYSELSRSGYRWLNG